MGSTKILALKTQIISEIANVTKTTSFKDWLNAEQVSTTGNQFVAINNSFIFRESIKTVKSVKYIGFEISPAKKFDTKKIFIVEGIGFNSHFKLFTLTSNHKKTKLEDAIKEELKEIGEVLYTIVGEIQDVNDISEPLSNSHFKKIILIPTLATDFQIVGDEIQIKDYSDRELIWTKIEAHCKTNSLDIADNLPGSIDKAITFFQNNAFSTLSLPKKFNPATKYLLDKISMVIEDHLKTYKTNISNIDTDPKAMIEILRISYNFVSDVNKLLALVINLCDLKPIILWMTISKYFNLDNKFKELPFGFSKKKASLSDYESVIKNARNKSFHQLFPFNKSLRFELAALEKVSVTIFSNHGNKDGNKMTYKDQELYDLLRSFTRVNEQLVSKNFWIKNEEVMKAVHELINATSEGIKMTR
jgi:hypothetical protein